MSAKLSLKSRHCLNIEPKIVNKIVHEVVLEIVYRIGGKIVFKIVHNIVSKLNQNSPLNNAYLYLLM